MKRYIIKNVMFLLLVGIILPAYAIDFDEPRKVLLPQNSNAVYRDLTVLDTMYLDVANAATRNFFLEIGKRPSYFWHNNYRHHLQQVQHLTFDNIQFNNVASSLTIQNMEVSDGAFIGQNFTLDINNTPNLTIYGNDTSFLMDNISYELPISFGLPLIRAIDLSLSSRILEYSYAEEDGVDEGDYTINSLYLRDLDLLNAMGGWVEFPSPRMMVQCNNCNTDYPNYNVIGTSREFLWKQMSTQTNLKNYYGPWENYNGTVSVSPCPDIPQDNIPNPDGKRCYKVSVTSDRYTEYTYDDNNSEFTCAGQTAPDGNLYYQNITYDPYYENGYCYDYQEIYPNIDKSPVYNDNGGVYEFVVQEVYAYKNDTSILENKRLTFLDQSPEVRFLDGKNIPLSTDTAESNWQIFKSNVNTIMKINGQNVSVSANNIRTNRQWNPESNDGSKSPCYVICEGTTCTLDYFYIRDRKVRHIKESDDIENHWPREVKQDMILMSYVVGYCPNRSTDANNKQYRNHEINWKQPSVWKNLESLIPYTENNKVCIRREVKCNSLNGSEGETSSKTRQYFTTDY